MKKVLILSAALCFTPLAVGCVTNDAYRDATTIAEQEKNYNLALQEELTRRERQVSELQAANRKLVESLENQEPIIITRDPVAPDTTEVDRALAELRRELEGKLVDVETFNIIQADHAMGVRMDDGADVLFASGSWELTDSARRSLDTLAEIVKDSLQRNPSYIVRIDGHTDADPVGRLTQRGINSNTHLGFMRADAVRQFLVSKGVDQKRVVVLSAGEWRPVARDKNKNRRVEIWVSTEEGFSLGGRARNANVSR